MTVSNSRRVLAREYARGRSTGQQHTQKVWGGAALVCVALAGAFICWNGLAGADTDGAADVAAVNMVNAPAPAPLAANARRSEAAMAYAKLSLAMTMKNANQQIETGFYGDLFDGRHFLGFQPGAFISLATLESGDDEAATGWNRFTLPQAYIASAASNDDEPSRTAAVPAPKRQAQPMRTASLQRALPANREVADAPAHVPGIFEKLFGRPAPVALAYAAPDDADLMNGPNTVSARYDRWTAVYDISARKVYLPDGTELEAHSGLGSLLDDPRYADVRMRGVTPPAIYDLKLRESPFHGVRALRLIPVENEKVFGRSGLLAHTYMLGPKGDSNGCVSFRNYDAFLQAYMNHSIKRLAVVARLD